MFAKNLIVMKKLTLLLFASFALLACSRDDNKPAQDYTSFVVWHNSDVNLIKSVAGYYAPDGECIKLGELGDLSKGVKSNEIIVSIDTLNYVYIFTEYFSPRKLDIVFKLNKKTMNELFIPESTRGIEVDKNDKYQYPH
jgi:hypothetical protein